MALGSTQTLVKMSARNIPGSKGGRCVRLQPHHFHVPNVMKSGSLNLLERDLKLLLLLLLCVNTKTRWCWCWCKKCSRNNLAALIYDFLQHSPYVCVHTYKCTHRSIWWFQWVSSYVTHAVCSSFRDQYTACAQREGLFILQTV